MSAIALIRSGVAQHCAPHPRYLLAVSQWNILPAALAKTPALALLALWAEPGLVHAAFLDEEAGAVLLASAPAEGGRYAALSPVRPGAARFERAIHDLWGLEADDAVDTRPWLDHGRWGLRAPLSTRPVRWDAPAPQPEFLAAEGEGVHQIAVGPIHAGIIEPGHFRFHVQGEAVVRLEQRLGYTHKGTLSLMLGKSPRAAARYAARLSGDSTVAHGWAFAMAAEAALAVVPPPRALALRAVMAECERIANHLNDCGFICNDASFAWLHARFGLLRETLLRACDAAFGHRLMMDRVVPGGVALDILPGGEFPLLRALDAMDGELPELARVYDGHASLADRVVGAGIVGLGLAERFAATGPIGRASGRGFDTRRVPGYAPYDGFDVTVPVLPQGDVDARVRIRLAELGESSRLLRVLLATLPGGEITTPLPQRGGEGVGMVEAFRGDALHWLALDDGGLIRGLFCRDASWLQWPLLEAAMLGNIVADFPLINKSFNCSYSGVDL